MTATSIHAAMARTIPIRSECGMCRMVHGSKAVLQKRQLVRRLVIGVGVLEPG